MKVRFLILITLLLTACSQIWIREFRRVLEDSPKPVVDPNVAPLAPLGNTEELKILPVQSLLHAHVGRGAAPQKQISEPEMAVALARSGKRACLVHRLSRFRPGDFAKIPKCGTRW